MKYRTNTVLQAVLVVADVILLWTALFSAGNLRGSLDWIFRSNGAELQPMATDFGLYLAVTGVWLAVTLAFGTYQPASNRMAYRELSDMLKALLMSAIVLSGFLYLTGREVALVHFWYFMALALLVLVIFRIALRIAYRLVFHRGWKSAIIAPSRVVVVGEGSILYDTLCTLSNCDPKEVALLGFIDYQADLDNAITEAAEHPGSRATAGAGTHNNAYASTGEGRRVAGDSAAASPLAHPLAHPRSSLVMTREPAPPSLEVIEPVHTRASARAAARLAGQPVDEGRWTSEGSTATTPRLQLVEPVAPAPSVEPEGGRAHIDSSPLGLA
ncbi:MAG: hypothetical protein ACJ78Q_16710, partial [Chloroflexia bacterium]